jgi:hypothetical protein
MPRSCWKKVAESSEECEIGKMNTGRSLLSIIALSIIFLGFTLPESRAIAEQMMVLEDAKARIFFEPGVNQGAEEVSQIFPVIKTQTENLFKWRYSERASIVLINNRQRFLRYADHPITVAFADPANNTIVMDFSKIATKPFSLETTLTHEFCHLLLHRHLPDIPRWLDEGLCQWASGGLDEIMYDRKRASLNQAALSGRLIDFESIEHRFPRSEQARILAYEQSKNFVTYLDRRFGTNKLRALLVEMKTGTSVYEAISKTFDTPYEKLEREWAKTIGNDLAWLTYLSTHIDIFLFVGAAMVTVFGFIKFLWKKRYYRDEFWDDDDDEFDF